MDALLTYFIKVTSILAMVWFFYTLVLQKNTFYTINRGYFLVGISIAFLLPCLSLPRFAVTHPIVRQVIEPFSEWDVVPTTVLSAADLIIWVIGGGGLLFLLHFGVKLISLLNLKRRAQVQTLGNTKVYLLQERVNPFSFLGHIFLNPDMHSEAEMAEMIAHEISHIKQRHTIDLMLSEALVIVSWFNPFAWLLRKAMRQNLEYLADRHVLKSGFDTLQYQYILVRTTINGIPGLSIAHNFTFSNLKKRIMMMNKKRTSHAAMLKYALLLPLIAFAWMGVQAAEVTYKLNEITITQESKQDTTLRKQSRKVRTDTPVHARISPDKRMRGNHPDQNTQYYIDNELVTRETFAALDRKEVAKVSVKREDIEGQSQRLVYVTTKKPGDETVDTERTHHSKSHAMTRSEMPKKDHRPEYKHRPQQHKHSANTSIETT